MALPIISADQRLAEPRGVKGTIFGKSGIGKTSLLWTLNRTTLFIDLEAGDLAIEGWSGDSVAAAWAERRDFAVYRSICVARAALLPMVQGAAKAFEKTGKPMSAAPMACTAR